MLAHFLTTLLLLLPVLTLALPHNSRDAATCTPTAYTISSYTANPTKPNQSIHLAFRSAFPDPSLVTDAALSSAVCDASADSSGNFPNELTCSTRRSNLEVDLRGELGSGKLMVIHFWRCGGKNWMSSTPVDIDAGSEGEGFLPQNVREVPCGAPTCP
ncbi:hypothetical protein PSPO01_05615 [Paraphaeosphaeria sporulosa]